MAPGASDLSTVAYAYTSSVDQVAHPNAGLIGMLIVAAPGSLAPALEGPAQEPGAVAKFAGGSSSGGGSSGDDSSSGGAGSSSGGGGSLPLPKGVDRLVPLLFNIQNENESPYLRANMAAAGVEAEAEASEEFEESNLMHSINGGPLLPSVPACYDVMAAGLVAAGGGEGDPGVGRVGGMLLDCPIHGCLLPFNGRQVHFQ
jgi:hypothetical protein